MPSGPPNLLRGRAGGIRLVLVGALVFASAASAQYRNPYTLYYEQPRGTPEQFHFKEETLRVKPEPSDFRVEDYTLMSNDIGERWALITFRNSSTSSRILKNDHIVATLANGQRVHALNLNERIGGSERFTQAVFFGISKFPILFLEVGS